MDINDIDFKSIPLDRIDAELKNAVYKAAMLFERLEDAGRIRGNGHHMAQKIADKASALLRERWIDETQVKET